MRRAGVPMFVALENACRHVDQPIIAKCNSSDPNIQHVEYKFVSQLCIHLTTDGLFCLKTQQSSLDKWIPPITNKFLLLLNF